MSELKVIHRVVWDLSKWEVIVAIQSFKLLEDDTTAGATTCAYNRTRSLTPSSASMTWTAKLTTTRTAKVTSRLRDVQLTSSRQDSQQLPCQAPCCWGLHAIQTSPQPLLLQEARYHTCSSSWWLWSERHWLRKYPASSNWRPQIVAIQFSKLM